MLLLKNNEFILEKNLKNKRDRRTTKFKEGDLDKIADLKRTMSKSHTTTWSYELYTTEEINDDTKPTYHKDKKLEI